MNSRLAALVLAGSREAWRRDALCCEPEHVGLPWDGDALADVEQCRPTCDRCAVSDDCLAYALSEAIMHGTWGGTGPKDRRAHQASARQARARERAS